MILDNYSDEFFMKRALLEANRAFEEEEVPIGAVIVSENKIIGKGYNQTERLNDVTAHAEIVALTAAADFLGSKYLKNCKIYVTLEPCAMCAAALNASQIEAVVFGASDPKMGYLKYKPSLIHSKIKVKKGVFENECGDLLKSFFEKKRNKKA